MTAAQFPTLGPRDLRFHPAGVARPRKLTPQQIAAFNRDGFLKGFRIYSPAEADRNRAMFDALLEKVRAANDGRDAYSINGYHSQCASLWDVVTEPRILDYVEDLLGPDFVCWGTHYFCKVPGDHRSVPWHQDASYWPLTPSKTVTVWLAIDDADRANGAMRVLPGTHARGHLEFDLAQPGEAVVLNQKVRGAERFGAPVYFELAAGEISLHADMLVHGSDPNLSDRRRCGLTLRYATTDVRVSDPTFASWSQGAVLCRGRDPHGHWANVPRPAGESIEPKPWQKTR